MTTAPVPIDDYYATDFVVFHDDREIVVHIDEHSAELDQLFTKLGASSGLFITGWNPYSRPQSDGENETANARMANLFAERGIVALAHVGRSRDGAWCEEGFFALDLHPEVGLAIAAELQQHAILFVAKGGWAELKLTGV